MTNKTATDNPTRAPRELPIGKAIEAIRAIDADEAKAIAEARDKAEGQVRRAHAKFRQTVLAKVHPSAVAIVLKEAGREVPLCFEPKGRDVPAMTADEMRAALDGMPEPHFTVQPKTRAGDPLYVSADEIDDDAPLDNADATADDEPQAGSDTAEPLPKGAAPYEPGPAAKAAMGRHR